MVNEIHSDANSRMDKSLSSLENDFSKIRAGRAHPSLLEQITVEYYGALVPLSHPLANVNGNYNAVEIMGDLVGKLWIQGEGAGKNSTTSAVLGDLLGIYNSSSADIVLDKDNGQYMDDNETFSRNYVRLSVEDRYGVLSQISGIFSENKISISSVIQKDAAEMDGSVDLVVMTHEASQKNFLMAIKKINSLSVVKSNPVTIRIHE